MENTYRHTVTWDDTHQIVRIFGHGVADAREAEFLILETERMAKEHGNGLKILLDLSQITKTTSEGRKIMTKATGHPSVYKLAMVGASTIMRTVSNFISAAAGQSNAMHFKTEREALKWLGEE